MNDSFFKIPFSLIQTPKFRTLAITIYRYHNFDLAVMIAKIVQKISVTAKKKKKRKESENNILLKTDLREKNYIS